MSSPSSLHNRFQFYAEAPAPKSVIFSNSLQALIVTMNYDAKPLVKGTEDCASFFHDTTQFGTRSRCVMRTPWIMLIQLRGALRGAPTIAPNDQISFINGSLVRRFESVTQNSTGLLNLTVGQPAKSATLIAEMDGPQFIGIYSHYCQYFL